MIQNINDDRQLEVPSLTALEGELRQLGPDEYAILDTHDEHYIQTYRNDDGTFVLEYRDGSADAHFGTAEPVADLAEVLWAFSLYLQSDPRWKSGWDWERIEFSDEDFLNEDNSYFIGGEVYRKVLCRSESYAGRFAEGACPDCGASAGVFHAPGCPLEQCPRCGEANHCCDCE